VAAVKKEMKALNASTDEIKIIGVDKNRNLNS
jgi:hypothetical protein